MLQKHTVRLKEKKAEKEMFGGVGNEEIRHTNFIYNRGYKSYNYAFFYI